MLPQCATPYFGDSYLTLMHQDIEQPGVAHSAIVAITAPGLIVPWALAGANISYMCAPELTCAGSKCHHRSSKAKTDPPTEQCVCVCGVQEWVVVVPVCV